MSREPNKKQTEKFIKFIRHKWEEHHRIHRGTGLGQRAPPPHAVRTTCTRHPGSGHALLASEGRAADCSVEHLARSESPGRIGDVSLSSGDVSSEEGARQILGVLFFEHKFIIDFLLNIATS